MWRPLQDGQTPRPLQLAIGRAGHPWPRPAGQPMGTPRVPMAAKPGSAGPPRRTPCGTSCRPRGRIRSRGCRTRDSRGVPPRRSPARAALPGRATRANSQDAPTRSCGAESSRGTDARSGVPARGWHEAGGEAARETRRGQRPWAERWAEGRSVRAYTTGGMPPPPEGPF